MQLATINKSMFRRPQHLLPSAWTGHLPFSGWIIEEHAPDVFVELGTHHGASYFGFCQAVLENAANTKCFAVDTWEGDEHAGLYGGEVYENVLRINQDYYSGFSQLLRMRFDDAADYFADGTVDLLHIDGLHTYEAVLHDYEVWLPKMSDRGVILFHDTMVREREFGVWRLWAELSVKFPSLEFHHAHGLGVLLVGDSVGDGLLGLGSMSEKQRVLFRALFESLGDRVECSATHEQLRVAKEELIGLKSLRQEERTRLEDAYFRLGEADAFARTQVAYAEQLTSELRSAREAAPSPSQLSGSMIGIESTAESLIVAMDGFAKTSSDWMTSFLEEQREQASAGREMLASGLLESRAAWKEVAEALGSQQELISEIQQNLCSENERVERISRELVKLSDATRLRTLLEERERSLAAKDKEVAELRSRAEQLESEMDEIKSSPSWRWTSVLRRPTSNK